MWPGRPGCLAGWVAGSDGVAVPDASSARSDGTDAGLRTEEDRRLRAGFGADLYITEASSGGPRLESTGLTPARGKVRTSGAAGQARRIRSVAVARGTRPSGSRGQRAVGEWAMRQ